MLGMDLQALLMSGRILDGLFVPIWITEEFLAVCRKDVLGESGCVHCDKCASDM